MRIYVAFNLLVAFGFVLFWILRTGLGVNRFSARFWLRLGQTVLVSAVLFSIFSAWIPSEDLFKPIGHAWSRTQSYATKMGLENFTTGPNAVLQKSITLPKNRSLAPLNGLIILGVLLMAWTFVKSVLSLRSTLKDSVLARRIGRVQVRVSDKNPVPFAAWLGRAYVVIPTELLGRPLEMRVAIRHELQHHRQKDLLWAYFMEALKVAIFFNPLIYAWSKTTNHLQEFACDEHLIRTRKVSLKAYGSCLIETAQTALKSRALLVGTTSMAAGFDGKALKRRIEMMFEYEKTKSSRWISALVVLGTLTLLAAAAYAQQSTFANHSLTYAEAEALAAKSNLTPEFPVEMNRAVFKTLNGWLSNDRTRASLKLSLKRMSSYEPMIRKKIEAFELADELIAVPIVESRYENFNDPKTRGAGLWGFITPTAKNYGLHVTEPNDPTKDERLVEHRETLAAMRYFTHLRHDLFRDWRLALRAYNEGEDHVHNLIDRYKTRDPWALERLEPSKENYLPQVIAAIIVLRNPSILD